VLDERGRGEKGDYRKGGERGLLTLTISAQREGPEKGERPSRLSLSPGVREEKGKKGELKKRGNPLPL